MKLPVPSFSSPETSELETRSYSLLHSPETFALLSDGLYQYKALAAVREPVCNAIDSHHAAGIPDVPVAVHLPSGTEPYFSVTDQGHGMSKTFLTELFSVIGWSSKHKELLVSGGLGIGSKSPFAFLKQCTELTDTPSFQVTSTTDTERTVICAFLDASGVPKMSVLSCEPSNGAPTGTEVRFEVPEPTIAAFNEAAQQAMGLMTPFPTITGGTVVKLVRRPITQSRDLFMARSLHPQIARLYVVQNNVVYPVSGNMLRDVLGHNVVNGRIRSYWSNVLPRGTSSSNPTTPVACYLQVPPNSVDFVPSREALQETSRTQETLTAALVAAYEALGRQVAAAFSDCHTPTRENVATLHSRLGHIPWGYVSQHLSNACWDYDVQEPAQELIRALNVSQGYFDNDLRNREGWKPQITNIKTDEHSHNPLITSTSTLRCRYLKVRSNATEGLAPVVDIGLVAFTDNGHLGTRLSPIALQYRMSADNDIRFLYQDVPDMRSVVRVMTDAAEAFMKKNPGIRTVSWFLVDSTVLKDSEYVLKARAQANNLQQTSPFFAGAVVQSVSSLLKDVGVPVKGKPVVPQDRAAFVLDVTARKAKVVDIDALTSDVADTWLVCPKVSLRDGKVRYDLAKERDETLHDRILSMTATMQEPPASVLVITHQSAVPSSMTANKKSLQTLYTDDVRKYWAATDPLVRGIANFKVGRFQSTGPLHELRTGTGFFSLGNYAEIYESAGELQTALGMVLGAPAPDDSAFRAWFDKSSKALGLLHMEFRFDGTVTPFVKDRRGLQLDIPEVYALGEVFPCLKFVELGRTSSDEMPNSVEELMAAARALVHMVTPNGPCTNEALAENFARAISRAPKN